eukprot:gene6625-332_t
MSLRSVVNALVRRENFQEKSKAEYIEDEHQPRHQWKTHRYKENGSQLKPDGTMERQSRGRSDKDYLSSPIHRREHRQNHQHLDRTSHKHYSRKLTANSRSPSPVSPVDHNQHGIFQSSKQPAIWNTHSDTQDSEYEDKFSRLLGIVTKPMSSGDTHSVSSSRSAPAADQTIKVQALWLSLYSHRGSFSDFTLKTLAASLQEAKDMGTSFGLRLFQICDSNQEVAILLLEQVANATVELIQAGKCDFAQPVLTSVNWIVPPAKTNADFDFDFDLHALGDHGYTFEFPAL